MTRLSLFKSYLKGERRNRTAVRPLSQLLRREVYAGPPIRTGSLGVGKPGKMTAGYDPLPP